jgi:hypothetical protein
MLCKPFHHCSSPSRQQTQLQLALASLPSAQQVATTQKKQQKQDAADIIAFTLG